MGEQPTATPAPRGSQAAALRALRAGSGLTVTELMAATDLSRPTIHAACEELVRAGLALETEAPSRPATRGRPPRSFSFNARATYVLGVDVGATSVRSMLTDLGTHILGEAETTGLSADLSAAERISVIRTCMRRSMSTAGVRASDITSVGVGMPAPVRLDRRVIALPDYLRDLPDADIAAALAESTTWNVLIENDANLAGLAETRIGAAQGQTDVITVLAGERLGAGVILDGRLLRGAGGATGELSFARLIEGVDGAYGIGMLARTFGQRAATDESTSTALQDRCDGDPADLTSEDVFRCAAEGDRIAQDCIHRATGQVARILEVLQLALDPATIVMSGGIAQAPGVLDALRAHAPLLPESELHPPTIVGSTLAHRAVATGAATLAIEDVWSRLTADPMLLVSQ
ncbi:ROK family protein [Demetria terragena]|uniref:ROK family protein n=1 Tax=Demetria terragena TaxID=63959 RepID=UPI00036E3559|nr:ROK family protein [Demetria terragena]